MRRSDTSRRSGTASQRHRTRFPCQIGIDRSSAIDSPNIEWIRVPDIRGERGGTTCSKSSPVASARRADGHGGDRLPCGRGGTSIASPRRGESASEPPHLASLAARPHAVIAGSSMSPPRQGCGSRSGLGPAHADDAGQALGYTESALAVRYGSCGRVDGQVGVLANAAIATARRVSPTRGSIRVLGPPPGERDGLVHGATAAFDTGKVAEGDPGAIRSERFRGARGAFIGMYTERKIVLHDVVAEGHRITAARHGSGRGYTSVPHSTSPSRTTALTVDASAAGASWTGHSPPLTRGRWRTRVATTGNPLPPPRITPGPGQSSPGRP